jgi:hypothetical protein
MTGMLLIIRRKKRRFVSKILHEKNIAANRRFFLLCPTNYLSSRIPTNLSLRRFGGMRDLLLTAELYKKDVYKDKF